MPVIETIGLGKEYRQIRGGRTVAVDGLDLSVPEGGVFGFLGPNGSVGRSVIEAALLLTLYAGLLVFAAAVSFRHRDVG